LCCTVPHLAARAGLLVAVSTKGVAEPVVEHALVVEHLQFHESNTKE
jgi:hypothetical protein